MSYLLLVNLALNFEHKVWALLLFGNIYLLELFSSVETSFITQSLHLV
jgi:hypothetical protein